MKVFKSIPYILILLSYFLSLVIFAYILVGYFVHIFNPKEVFIDYRLFEHEYVSILMDIGFVLSVTGWILFKLYIDKSNRKQPPLSFIDKTVIVLVAVMTQMFYMQDVELPHLYYYLLSGSLLLLFILIYPQIIIYYVAVTQIILKRTYTLKFDLHVHPSHTELSGKYILQRIFTIFLSGVLISISLFFISYTGAKYLKGKIVQENRLRDRLYIQRTIPTKTTHAEKVILKGHNFGWGSINDKRFTLMSTDGPINQVDKWEDNTIVFIVPLHLHGGKRQIWIKKPADQLNSQSKIIQSNHVVIEVFSRFDFYPAQDDTFIGKVYKKVRNFIFYNTIEDTTSLLK